MTPPTYFHATPGEWERLLAGGLHSPPEHPALRAAWERLRSRALHLDGLPEISQAELTRRAAAMRPVLDLLDSWLDTLGEQLPLDLHRAVFTDGDGVILWAAGGASAIEAPVLELLRPGVSCEEALVGTNAMGTCAALSRPVVVEGEAHVLRPFRALSCCAAPVFGPAGALQGVVNVSGPAAMDTAPALAFATNLAQLITDNLGRQGPDRVLEAHRALAEALIDQSEDCAMLFRNPGGIIRANGPACAQLRAMTGAADLPLHELGVEAFHAINGQAASQGRPTDSVTAVWPRITAAAARGERQIEILGQPVLVYPISDARGELAYALIISPRQVAHMPEPAPAQRLDPVVEAAHQGALRLAPSPAPLLILGQRGTGRRHLAQEIHTLSGRDAIHHVDCEGAPWRELEQRLFGGGRRGSPEGLLRARRADTVVLHAIEALPAPLQARLYRWLSESRVLIASRLAPRLVCTARPELRERVQSGSFRQDLYASLSPRLLSLPPLAQRKDKPALVQSILRGLCTSAGLPPSSVDAPLQAAIDAGEWPGNVAGLRATLEAAARLAGGGVLGLQHVVSQRPATEAAEPATPGPRLDLEAMAEKALRDALLATGGNVTNAAKQLGIARSTMYRMLNRYDLR